MTRMICIDGGPRCAPHELGEVPIEEKCPGLCDAPGCQEPYAGESARSEDSYCSGHLVLDEAGATREEMGAAGNKAALYGVTLARLLREAVRMVPLQPEIDRVS